MLYHDGCMMVVGRSSCHVFSHASLHVLRAFKFSDRFWKNIIFLNLIRNLPELHGHPMVQGVVIAICPVLPSATAILGKF